MTKYINHILIFLVALITTTTTVPLAAANSTICEGGNN